MTSSGGDTRGTMEVGCGCGESQTVRALKPGETLDYQCKGGHTTRVHVDPDGHVWTEIVHQR